MTIRRTSVLVSSGLALAFAAASLPIANAADNALTAGSGVKIESNLTEVLSSDAEFQERMIEAYIRDNAGASRAAALAEMKRSTQVTQAVQEFKDKFPQAFATNENSGTTGLRIFVTGTPSADMLKFATSAPLPIELVPGARVNQEGARKLINIVNDAFFNDTNTLVGWTDYDFKKNTIELHYFHDGDATLDSLGRVARAQALASSTVSALLAKTSTKVNFIFDKSAGGERATMVSGGTALGLGSSTTLECTAAFTVYGGSKRGLITAGHCDNNMNYEGHPNTLVFEKALERYQGDAQWHSTSDNTRRAFVYDRSGNTLYTKDLTAYTDPANDTTYWTYGSTTARARSSKVIAVNQKRNRIEGGVRVYYEGMTITNSNVGDNGDSGGPWYTGSGSTATGVGITSGHSVENNQMTISPLRSNAQTLGVLVRTN